MVCFVGWTCRCSDDLFRILHEFKIRCLISVGLAGRICPRLNSTPGSINVIEVHDSARVQIIATP